MGRPAKAHKAVNLKMEVGLHDRLTVYSEKSGVTKTKIIEKALEAYLNECDWKASLLQKREQRRNAKPIEDR